jgi:hypothetical protein
MAGAWWCWTRGAASRSSGDQGASRERDSRKRSVSGAVVTRGDLIEAVVLLPENLCPNTTAPGIILYLSQGRIYMAAALMAAGFALARV